MASTTALTHRVDRYAERVHEGDIVAGPLVRLACDRHLKERRASLKRAGHPRGFWFDDAAADHIIAFFETVLRLPDTLDEHGEPIPFLLTPANTFIVGSLFGWKLAERDGGWRRYRESYTEEGKGNAKTPLAAGIGLYGLTMDGEQAAEIYSAATGIDQAKLCWLDAQRMVDASPELAAIIHQSQNNLAYEPALSFFRPVSNEKRGKSGPRPHVCLIDELHEHADAVIVNKLRAGAKRRRQPLFFEITNSGFDRTSICWQHHEHSRKVLEGIIEDDRWFGYVCGLDTDDDPLTDQACHVKANPNLGIVIHQEYLDRQVAGKELLPVVAGYAYRLVDVALIAVGGAAATATSVDVIGTRSAGTVRPVVAAVAALTQSTVARAGAANMTVLADGASHTPLDANTPVVLATDAYPAAGSLATATHVDAILTYVMEAA